MEFFLLSSRLWVIRHEDMLRVSMDNLTPAGETFSYLAAFAGDARRSFVLKGLARFSTRYSQACQHFLWVTFFAPGLRARRYVKAVGFTSQPLCKPAPTVSCILSGLEPGKVICITKHLWSSASLVRRSAYVTSCRADLVQKLCIIPMYAPVCGSPASGLVEGSAPRGVANTEKFDAPPLRT